MAGFYWWLIAKTQVQHLVTGAVIGLVVAASVSALATRAGLSFKFKWPWLGLLVRRLAPKVPRDLGLVALAMWKGLVARAGVTGNFQQVPFNVGGADPVSATRRALVMGGISLPPNTFAAGVEGKGTLIVHQLVFERGPANPDWPL
jgi:hypothetical protein